MQTPTADTITKSPITKDTAFSLTPAGLAALEGFAPGVTTEAQNALEAPETAPGHGNEALEDEVFQPEGFYPDTADKVDWVLSKIADARARAARIRENAELMAKEADRQAEGLLWQFGPALQDFARRELTGKKKSIRLYHGVLGYRTKTASLTITNEPEARAWAEANCPTALRVDSRALAARLMETGEVIDGAQLVPAEEVFYVK